MHSFPDSRSEPYKAESRHGRSFRQLVSAARRDYNGESQQLRPRKSPSWPVPISCRSQNWRMAAGRIRRAFRSDADGAVIARLRVMRTPFRRRIFCKPFATWAMPAVAVGRLWNVAGTQCDLLWLPRPGVRGSKIRFRQKMLREFFASLSFMNRTTVLLVRENWNSIS